MPRKYLPLAGLVALAAMAFASSATAGAAITEFELPRSNSEPDSIVAGADGNLWFTEYGAAGNAIGRMAPSGALLAEYPIPTKEAHSEGIAVGPEGDVWFVENGSSKVGKVSPGGTVADFSTASKNAQPTTITPGPNREIWFTETATSKIGRMTPAGVPDGEFPTTSSEASPWGIVTGPDGNLWFTESSEKGNSIGVMSPEGMMLHQYPIPTPNAGAEGIVVGADSNIWFTEARANKIGRITTAGAITEFSIPTATANAYYLTAAPDGTVWFAEDQSSANRIGVVKTDGAIQELPVPSADADPYGITVGSDCNIWFTERADSPFGNRIGRFDRGGCPPTNISAPAISGSPVQGQTLTEAHGSWSNTPTSFHIQWKHCDRTGSACSTIAGATGQSYTLTSGDVGHAIRVQESASNAGGSAGPATSAATGVVAGLPRLTLARISGLRESNSVFAVAVTSTPLAGRAAVRRHHRGTVFSFWLDQPATLKIAIQTTAPGRRVNGRCRSVSPRLRRRPRCTRIVTLATLTRVAHVGRNRVPFSGRVRGRALGSGRYRAVFTAIDGAGRSAPRTLHFKIVKR